MKRVVVGRYGGPEVLEVVDDAEPRPGRGEVRVRLLAAGVSFTDALLRAGTYLGGPRPPFTPGYELVGVVDWVGPGCTRLQVGDRVASVTVWGAYAERVCLREADAVEVPDDLDPAVVVSLVLPYVTAYQLLHRAAVVAEGRRVLVHGAAGRVGAAALELGARAGLRLYGTASTEDHPTLERLGAVPVDRDGEHFLAQVRALTGDGVDVVLDGIGGRVSLRSFRALAPGGKLVLYGHYATLRLGRRSRRGWLEWYAATAAVGTLGLLSPRRQVLGYHIQRRHRRRAAFPVHGRRAAPTVGGGPRDPAAFRDDLHLLLELLRADKIHPAVAARLPLTEARRAHELIHRTATTGKLVLLP